MTQHLKIARESENDKVVRATERIMLREESLNTWGRLKTATRRRRSAAASRCSVINEEGQRVTISGAKPFVNAVTHHVDKRYTGATDAPISQGQLASDIGILANTESSQALLRGDYAYPEECDETTECILRELVPFFMGQPCPMNIRLEPSDFHWWRTAPEETQSS